MAGCDVLTDDQVSRMSRWLPYEKIGGLTDEQVAPVREDRIAMRTCAGRS